MDNQQKYWNGRKNFVARLWYYELQGLDIVNQFKYVGGFVLLIYGLVRFGTPWLILIGVAIHPILILGGYFKAWHMNKVVDYLTTELGTHWGRYTYELSEKQNKLLEEILKEIRERKL